MRALAIPDRTAARIVAQTGEGPAPVPGGDGEGQGDGPSRHGIGARRCRDYRNAQAGQRRRARAPRTPQWCPSVRRRGRRGRETGGSAFDGLGARKGKDRVSNPQHASEGADENAGATGLNRPSARPRDLRPDDVRKDRVGAGRAPAELEGRRQKILAVVEGVLAEAQGTLKDRLVESSKSLMVHGMEEGGELAITHYRVVRVKGDRSLLELTLETGAPIPRATGRAGSSGHRRSQIRH